MASTTALDTEFTPAVGDFIVQATGDDAVLLRKNASAAAFAVAGEVHKDTCMIVSNPYAGAVYKFAGTAATVARADYGT